VHPQSQNLPWCCAHISVSPHKSNILNDVVEEDIQKIGNVILMTLFGNEMKSNHKFKTID
jgi:hypothetical protein